MHYVLMTVDGSDVEVAAVTHSFEEAVEAGRKDVTEYYDDRESEEARADIAAYNESLEQALQFPGMEKEDVQFESGSSSYDYRIVAVGS